MPDSFDFMQILTLLLIALLFAKDTLLPWLGERLFGIKRPDAVGDDSSQGDRIEKMMRGLQLHYNHETTDLLTKISNNTEATKLKLEEFEKYGIPVRGNKI